MTSNETPKSSDLSGLSDSENLDETEIQSEEASPASDPTAALKAQLKEQEAKYLYLYADFETYKRRSIKEQSDLIKFGWESLARDLLGVIDNLERANEHAQDSVRQGLDLVLKEFQTALAKRGVQLIETIGKSFDPHLHEAVGQEPSDIPQGHISREMTKGYTLHGRLLRASRVVLSTGPKV